MAALIFVAAAMMYGGFAFGYMLAHNDERPTIFGIGIALAILTFIFALVMVNVFVPTAEALL